MQLRRTPIFDTWLGELRDRDAKAQILRRLARLVVGNPGDVRPVGQGLSEMRINAGPGYRIYFVQRGDVTILLLCGGDKSSQSRDIAKAKDIAARWKEA